jgi:hypothetical protein
LEEFTMSWGYWGIVTGLLVMLTLFFFCIDLMYDSKQGIAGGTGDSNAPGREDKASPGKHAA